MTKSPYSNYLCKPFHAHNIYHIKITRERYKEKNENKTKRNNQIHEEVSFLELKLSEITVNRYRAGGTSGWKKIIHIIFKKLNVKIGNQQGTGNYKITKHMQKRNKINRKPKFKTLVDGLNSGFDMAEE